jgi:hypothetical protein
MSEYIDSQLKILNSIYKNSIQNNEDFCCCQPIPKIHPTLFAHQIATIHEMKKKMKNLSDGLPALTAGIKVHSKLAILGSPENSGKTLTVLGLLADIQTTSLVLPQLPLLGANSNSLFYCLENSPSNFASRSNVIVVPNYLFSQWQKEIQTHTALDFIFVDSRKSLMNITNIPKNFLVSAKLYKNFCKFCDDRKIAWNILVFDEVQNIYINNNECEIPLSTNFIWLVTSNWIPLIFKQSYFSFQELLYREENNLVQLVPELSEFLRKNKSNYTFLKMESSVFFKNILPYNNTYRVSLVVRCSDNFIKESMKSILSLANISLQSKLCRPSVNLVDIRRFFQDNDVRADNLMPVIYADLQIPIQSLADIEQPMQIYMSDDCPICLDTPRYMALSDCCRHTYCASCILKNTILRGTCPLCRNNNTINSLRLLETSGNAVNLENLGIMNKLETAYNLIVDNSDSTILVFSSYKNILYNLGDKLARVNLDFQLISNKNNINSKDSNILLFTYQDNLSGLKIKNVKNIIILSDGANVEQTIHYTGLSKTPCKVHILQDTLLGMNI